jgi:MFS family permease
MTDADAQIQPELDIQVEWRTKSVTLAGVLLAFASVPMALSGTTVAVPAIAREFDGGGFALNWVVTGYFITASALMLITGTLADIVGRRRVFGIGAAWFGAGALGSAMAGNIVVLDVFRTVSGVGSACLMAAGGAMLGSVFTGRARTRVFAAVGTMVGAGLALGPVLAGLIVGQFGWRALFLFLAAAAGALLVATAAMPESRGEQTRIDLPGALGYVAGLVLAMVGVLQATDHGWTDLRVIAPIVVGLALLTWFVRRQRRVSEPLLDVSLLADRHIIGWSLAAVTLAVGLMGALTQLPIFLQATGRFGPEAAGTIMLALTVPVLALPPLAAALVGKGLSPRTILIAAVVLLVLGNTLLSRTHPDTTTSLIVASLLLIGAANGILTGLVDPQTLSRVPQHRLGMASGLLNTLRAAGNTLTLALFAGLLITQLQSRLGDRALAARIAAGDLTHPSQIAPYSESLQTTLFIVAITCAVLGTTAALLTRPHHRQPHRDADHVNQ